MHSLRVFSVLCGLCLGCSGQAAGGKQAQGADAHAAAGGEAGAASASAPEEPNYLGEISRVDLAAMLEQGLGPVLSRFMLEPAQVQGFTGFRVVAIDAAWSDVGIETGDIITRLNGQPIERPEQAATAYKSLRTASEIKVEIWRDGARSYLRYLIQ